VGRPYGAIEKTLSARLHPGEPARDFAARCAAAAALGIEHVVVVFPGPWTDEALATLGAAIPTLSEVGT
jgi:sugar phosphate isomerase/epimerase